MRSISRGPGVTVVFATLAFVAAACSGSSGASSTPEISPLANSEWQLTSMLGRTPSNGTSITLSFSTIQAGGFSGCNQYSTQYATLDTGLTFGAIASTRKQCAELISGIEQQYYTTLSIINHWSMSGDTLTLLNVTGDADLIYARMAPASVDGPWNITNVNNGQQAVVSVPIGVTANITFAPDNTVQGFGGCNNFSGGYSVDGDKITIGPLMSTMKACEEPANSFEFQLMTALQSSTKWSVTNGTLDLRDDSGAQQVAATSAIGR